METPVAAWGLWELHLSVTNPPTPTGLSGTMPVPSANAGYLVGGSAITLVDSALARVQL